MSRWPRGEAEIEQLLASKQLQQVAGGQANGEHLLEKAARTLATAGEIALDDPDSAYVLAYDAARYSATALLAQQGLRPTTSGGHYAVEVAVRAQFGDGFRAFAAAEDGGFEPPRAFTQHAFQVPQRGVGCVRWGAFPQVSEVRG